MASQNFLLFFLVSLIPLALGSNIESKSNDENSKIYIVYMGSLPEGGMYSPTSHHLSIMQQVTNNAASRLVRSYKRSFNGFAAKLTNQQREKIASMKGVVSVFPSKTFYLKTTRSWDFIGFSRSIKREERIESDLVIGVFDTGIWPESESFNDEGYSDIPKKWNGICEGGENFSCNKKIIGARWYASDHIGGSARDFKGHGTHTASTAAGKEVKDVSFYGFAKGIARGGVPSARIATYKVCDILCRGLDILSAFDDSIADGVNIITLSLGSAGAIDFVEDPIAIGSFHAMEKGILTVQSAGNEGPNLYSVDSGAPWLFSVAATTIDRKYIDKLILGNGETFIGKSVNTVSSNGTKFSIAVHNIHGEKKYCTYEYSMNCMCVDKEMVKRKIVMCGSGGMHGEDETAFVNGAIGSITMNDGTLYNDVAFLSYLPSVNLDPHDYDLVQSYINSTKDPKAEILKSEEIFGDINAPEIASFSSRGPNPLIPEILKPDISAPGVDILAAYPPELSPSEYANDTRRVKYSIMSGTSMACPHVAGIATYVKTFHPNWSPAAIKSAIMTTAKKVNGSYNLADEFSYGAGYVNPLQAIDPGLIYDISKEDYVQMLCNYGYDAEQIQQISGGNFTCHGASNKSLLKELNYPALIVTVKSSKSFNVDIHRTVTNVGFPNSTYKATISSNSKINITVKPEILEFRSLNEKQSFVVNVVGGPNPNQTAFSSSLVWSDGIHFVKSPIIVM